MIIGRKLIIVTQKSLVVHLNSISHRLLQMCLRFNRDDRTFSDLKNCTGTNHSHDVRSFTKVDSFIRRVNAFYAETFALNDFNFVYVDVTVVTFPNDVGRWVPSNLTGVNI